MTPTPEDRKRLADGDPRVLLTTEQREKMAITYRHNGPVLAALAPDALRAEHVRRLRDWIKNVRIGHKSCWRMGPGKEGTYYFNPDCWDCTTFALLRETEGE